MEKSFFRGISNLNFPDGTMHFITTPSDDQTYIITYSYDEKTEKLQREKGFLY